MSDIKKKEDLSKINLIQLKEILHRENMLLKNKYVYLIIKYSLINLLFLFTAN